MNVICLWGIPAGPSREGEGTWTRVGLEAYESAWVRGATHSMTAGRTADSTTESDNTISPSQWVFFYLEFAGDHACGDPAP